MFCLCSTFASTTWNRPVTTLGKIHLLPASTPSSLIYFSNRRCSRWSCINHSDVSTLYTHPSGMISNILQCNIRLAYPAGGRGGNKKATKLSHCQKNNSWISTFCMAPKYLLNGRYLSLAISVNHTVHVFICKSDGLSCRNRKKRKKKTLAHQLIPKGLPTVFPSPVMTAEYAQTATLSTCSEYSVPSWVYCLFISLHLNGVQQVDRCN